MNHRKAFFAKAFCLSFVFLIGLVQGCLSTSDSTLSPADEKKRLIVLSTIAPVEVMVTAIGGAEIKSECLITGELDPHSYQLVKGDREKFRRADLIFYSGLGLEHGPSLAACLANSSKTISLGQWLQNYRGESILRIDGVADPHLWMDINLWGQCLWLICQELTRAMPHHGAKFEKRAAQMTEIFNSMHIKIRNFICQIPPQKRYLVTTHDAFRYFSRAYLAEPDELVNGKWQERIMSPEGLAPESQISLQQMRRTLDFLAKYRVPFVFAETNVNQQSLAKIVQAAKARGLEVALAKDRLYGDSMPPYSSKEEGYRAYLAMISSNAKAIVSHLAPEANCECGD